MKRLQCEMRAECTQPVSCIGEKGYLYCAACAAHRHDVERTRRLRPFEIRILEAGRALPSYAPLSKFETLARMPGLEWQPSYEWCERLEIPSFAVWRSLEAGCAAYPEIPRDAWQPYAPGDIEEPSYMNGRA
jgi:hypothetical protein